MMDRKTWTAFGERYPRLGPIVDITFKRGDGFVGLIRLHALRGSGLVIFEDEILTGAIVVSGKWDSDRDRVVEVRFPRGEIWSGSILMHDIVRDVESMRLATEHPLNVLMTGRKKIQEENASRIIHECYGDLNHKKLPELDMQLMGELEVVDGLPQITFTLKSLCGLNKKIVLDGWSGQMIVDGTPQEKAYQEPAEFHRIIEDMALVYLDEVTS